MGELGVPSPGPDTEIVFPLPEKFLSRHRSALGTRIAPRTAPGAATARSAPLCPEPRGLEVTKSGYLDPERKKEKKSNLELGSNAIPDQ